MITSLVLKREEFDVEYLRKFLATLLLLDSSNNEECVYTMYPK